MIPSGGPYTQLGLLCAFPCKAPTTLVSEEISQVTVGTYVRSDAQTFWPSSAFTRTLTEVSGFYPVSALIHLCMCTPY